MRIRAHKQGVEQSEAEGDDDSGVVQGLEERRRAKAAAAASKERKGKGKEKEVVPEGILKIKRSGSHSRVQFDDGVDGVGGGGVGGGVGGGGASTTTGNGESGRVQRESTDRRFDGLAALEAEARVTAEPTEWYPNEEEEAY